MREALVANMSVSEFWDASLHEVFIAIAAHQQRKTEAYEMQAWVISWHSAFHLKKPLSPNKILGKQDKIETKASDFNNLAEFKAYMNEKRDRKEEKDRLAHAEKSKTRLQRLRESQRK